MTKEDIERIQERIRSFYFKQKEWALEDLNKHRRLKYHAESRTEEVYYERLTEQDENYAVQVQEEIDFLTAKGAI